VTVEQERDVVLVAGVQDSPALYLAGLHLERGIALAVDGEKADRSLLEDGGEVLDHPVLIE
jgi:hypothetical protein